MGCAQSKRPQAAAAGADERPPAGASNPNADKPAEVVEPASKRGQVTAVSTEKDLLTKTLESDEARKVSVGLHTLVLAHKDEAHDAWVSAILQEVEDYANLSKGKPAKEKDAITQRLKNNNLELLNGLIGRLGEEQDRGGVRRACESIANSRFKSAAAMMPLESVLHATRVFEIPAINMFKKYATPGASGVALAPEDASTVQEILQNLLAEACNEVISEHYMAMVRHSPGTLSLCPPEFIFQKKGWKKGDKFDKKVLREVFIDADVNGKYTVLAFINSGAFGHGWRCKDRTSGKEVFMKTFVTGSEVAVKMERHVASIIHELESSERLISESRIMSSPHVVKVLDVIRSGQVTVPRNGVNHTDFHALVTEYCNGGELFNYVVTNEATGETKSMQEPFARFIFKQVLNILMVLYPLGSAPTEQMMHGDIKLENLVVSGSTVKLADYGSLTRVKYLLNTTCHHGTHCYNNPHFHTPMAVDVWATGVLLFLATTLGELPEVGIIKRHGRVPWDLLTGRAWGSSPLTRLGGWLGEVCTEHPLMSRSDDSMGSLLNLIFRHTAPCTVQDVANHKWLQGHTMTETEAHVELRSRYQGLGGSEKQQMLWRKPLPNCASQDAAQSLVEKVVARAVTIDKRDRLHVANKSAEKIAVHFPLAAASSAAGLGGAEDKVGRISVWVEADGSSYTMVAKPFSRKVMDMFITFQLRLEEALVEIDPSAKSSSKVVAAGIERQRTARG